MAKEPSKAQTEGGLSVRSLYRVVSDTEYEEILRTHQFGIAGGAEGKYFWENLDDANQWLSRISTPARIVEARYLDIAVEQFHSWAQLDRLGAARFANESEMNQSLLEIRSVAESE